MCQNDWPNSESLRARSDSGTEIWYPKKRDGFMTPKITPSLPKPLLPKHHNFYALARIGSHLSTRNTSCWILSIDYVYLNSQYEHHMNYLSIWYNDILPSGNQTWQWKPHYLVRWFYHCNSIFIEDFPACRIRLPGKDRPRCRNA